MISSFKDEYAFLSNFYPCIIEFSNMQFGSVEVAYQAAKSPYPHVQRQFCELNSSQAKRKGQRIELRSNWNQIRIPLMKIFLVQKFSHPELKKLLLDTGNAELVEGNYWNDTFWGVCNHIGQNNLGKLLMEVRSELK